MLLLLPLLCTTSCAFRPSWREHLVEDAGFDQVWEAMQQSLAAARYLPDLAQTDRGERKLWSRWKEAADFFHGGVRSRLRAEVLTEPQKPRQHTVRVCIERQRTNKPGELYERKEGDWSADGQDADRENFFLEHIKVRMAQWQEAKAGTDKPDG
jgi:hypothetical protein